LLEPGYGGPGQELIELLRDATDRAKGPQPALLSMMPATQGMVDVLAERARQRAPRPQGEGWDAQHDDNEHLPGDLAQAGICYARETGLGPSSGVPGYWPFDPKWWKPKDRRRNLVRAAALIVAEIDRMDRNAAAAAREAKP